MSLEASKTSGESTNVAAPGDMELKRHKLIRKKLRANTTRAINNLNKTLSEEETDINLVLSYLQLLESYQTELTVNDENIQLCLDDTQVDKDIEECFQIQEKIFKHINLSRDYLEQQKPRSRKGSGSSHSRSQSHQSERTHGLFRPLQKKLPTFSGDIFEFQKFIELFESAVDKKDYEEIDKLEALFECLKGTASKLVSGYSLTSSNYKRALDLLKDTYGNKAKVVETIILKMTSLPCPKYNYMELEQFRADLRCYMESLKNQDMIGTCQSCTIILGVLMAQKLPIEVRDKVKFEHLRDNWTLDSILELLNKSIFTLEATGHKLKKEEKEKSKKEAKSQKSSQNNKNNGAKTKVSTLVATESETKSKVSTPVTTETGTKPKYIKNKTDEERKRFCRYCSSERHLSSACDIIKTTKDRIEYVKRKGWCLTCLSSQHTQENCTKKLYSCRCGAQHNIALCDSGTKPSPQKDASNKENKNQQEEQSETEVLTASLTDKTGVALPLADLMASNGVKEIPVRSIFDQGSQKTLVARSVVRALNCTPLYKEKLTINGIHGKGKAQMYDVVSFKIKTDDGFIPLNAVVVDRLTSGLYIPGLVKTTKLLKRHNIYLANPEQRSDTVSDVGLLVGSDYCGRIFKQFKTVKGINLIDSSVGHLIWGKLPFASSTSDSQVSIVSVLRMEVSIFDSNDLTTPYNSNSFSTIKENRVRCLTTGEQFQRAVSMPQSLTDEWNNQCCIEDIRSENTLITTSQIPNISNAPTQHLEESVTKENTIDSKNNTNTEETDTVIADLEKLWSLSHIGISPQEIYTEAEKNTLESFRKNLSFEEGRYVVSLPWKENHLPLPDNYSLSKRRLYSVLNKLNKNPEMLTAYDEVIQDQLSRDFIEEVFPLQSLHPEAKLHYLPHHAVMKASSTTSLRLVFDCSSNKPSLNDSLHSGPSLITDLSKVLLKFRLKKYATSSDIEKAFLGIRLHEKDRDSTRFLWVKDCKNPNSPLVTYRFKSVLFGATCSPFLLAACLQHHVNLSEPKYKNIILDQIYVDNIFCNFDSEEEICEFFDESRNLFSKAGLNLREWTSNSKNANSFFRDKQLGIEETTVKILGLTWCTENDTISYCPKSFDTAVFSKRTALSHLASIFDPHGFLSPITIKGKIFLQKLWKEKYKWDKSLSPELQKEWTTLVKQFNNCLKFNMPRQLVFSNEVELHLFSDASNAAYATAAYIVSNNSGTLVSNLLIAKSRVSPIKELSIPRLELMGALLSSRLYKFIQSAYEDLLNIKTVTCWCDSQVTLQWLHSSKQLPTFIQNRVDEIRKNVPHAQWRFVPGKDNPADLASRGASHKYLFSDLWKNGPSWLTKPDEWPIWVESPMEETDNSILISNTSEEESLLSSPILEYENYSSLSRIIRITALVFRFIQNLKNTRSRVSLNTSYRLGKNYTHDFSREETIKAETYWFQHFQQNFFKDELLCLERGNNYTLLTKQLNLKVVDGLIRCDRRLHNSLLSPESKYPILLPSKSCFTELLIWSYHNRYHHVGITQLITLIRQKFYFVKMRQTIKKVVRKCVLCKRLQAVHFKSPPLAALPSTRVCESKPFSVIGVDLTGYFHVKQSNTKNSPIIKSYICLFTCATTRGIHLELVFDNSVESFLGALRRFTSRRGTPTVIYSDNATYFKAASQFLYNIHKLPSVKEYFKTNSINWRFNPARSSHFGGFFERLIGLVKLHLKRILKSSLITYDEFHTIITEVESIVNCRPLTYVGDELLGSDPLTPSQLIMGYNLNNLPIPTELLESDEDYENPVKLNRRFLRLKSLLSKFQNQWKTDYLLSLRQAKTNSNNPQLVPGDVVLVESDDSRLKWKLGIVELLHVSPDGFVRSVTLKTKTGQITRAIIHIYPLEIHSSISSDTNKSDSPTLKSSTERPLRQAKTLANTKIKAILNDE